MFLLDTHVISEFRKIRSGRAADEVMRWNASVSGEDLFLSVITLYELETGVLRKSKQDAAQGALLQEWLQGSVREAFRGRVLDVDAEVASRAAVLQTLRPFATADAFLAATAYTKKMKMVTRNVQHFEGIGIEIVNPWLPAVSG